jgi:hypothetical protein
LISFSATSFEQWSRPPNPLEIECWCQTKTSSRGRAKKCAKVYNLNVRDKTNRNKTKQNKKKEEEEKLKYGIPKKKQRNQGSTIVSIGMPTNKYTNHKLRIESKYLNQSNARPALASCSA